MTGRCAAQHRADRARNDAVPVQVAAAVEVAAARHDHRQAVGVRVGLGDQVGAALAHVVGVPPLQRGVLVVGQFLLVAVGLVRGGHDDLLHGRAAAAGFEQRPGSADVGLEGRNRVAVGDAHDRLGRQVDDAARSRIRRGRARPAPGRKRRRAPRRPARADRARRFAVRHPVAHQADDAGAGVQQPADQPAAHQSRGPRHQHRMVLPERWVHSHTFHGALPLAQRSLRILYSRYVSIAKKKPAWR